MILPIGLPGSGKSTWARDFVLRSKAPVTVVSTDALVDAAAAEAGITYEEAWAALDGRKLERRARRTAWEAIGRGEDVIVDRTNLRRRTRGRFLRLVSCEGWAREAVVFAPPCSRLLRQLEGRAATGGKRIGLRVMLEMAAAYEPPEPGEFDAVRWIEGVDRVETAAATIR